MMNVNHVNLVMVMRLKVGWLISGAPTFVIWHNSLIHSSELVPLINSGLVLVSSAKVKVFYAVDKKVNYFDNNIKRLIFFIQFNKICRPNNKNVKKVKFTCNISLNHRNIKTVNS